MWDLRGTNSYGNSKVLGATGGPPGSRSQRLRIKRGMHMVGLVRWCRIGNGMKCGIFERSVQLRIALANVRSRNETLERSATSCAFANLEGEPPRTCSPKFPTLFRFKSYRAHSGRLEGRLLDVVICHGSF